MAREQRKDVDYFPHDCTHGRKMHIIEAKYGNDGYAAWFKLLEQLGKANNHHIDISDETNLMFLTSIFKITEEKTILILNDLAKLEAIDKFLYENHKVIFSQKFSDSITDAYRKRKNKIFEYSDLLNELGVKTDQSGGRLTQKEVITPVVIPKVKKSKVNKSKEENINNILLSEIKISDDSDFIIFKNEEFEILEKDKQYLKTAISFQKLFIKNLKEKNSPSKNQEQAKYKNYVTPIRLMIESDGVDYEQIREAYKYLNSLEGEFWKKNILSTESLRKNIQKLIINKNTQSNGSQSQQQSATGSKKRAFKFSIDGAEKALASKTQRRLSKVESDNLGSEEYID